MIVSVLIALFGVFISSISQVLLKKSASIKRESVWGEYLNPYVIIAYTLFVAATLCSTFAFKRIPLSMGPVLDATGYLYVVFFGVNIFHERIDRTKILALILIIVGVVVYSFGV